jgi:hypothetical protein
VLNFISEELPRKSCKNDGRDAPDNGMDPLSTPTETEQEIVKSHSGLKELDLFDYQAPVKQTDETGDNVHASAAAERLYPANDVLHGTDTSTALALLSLASQPTRAAHDISEDKDVTLRRHVTDREPSISDNADQTIKTQALHVEDAYLYSLELFPEFCKPGCLSCHERREVKKTLCGSHPDLHGDDIDDGIWNEVVSAEYPDVLGPWHLEAIGEIDVRLPPWAGIGHTSQVELSGAASPVPPIDEHNSRMQVVVSDTSTLSGMSAMYGCRSLYQAWDCGASQHTKSSGPEIPGPLNTALDEELREARKSAAYRRARRPGLRYDPTKLKRHACNHKDCTFSTRYRKDLRRHMFAHQKHAVNKFPCTEIGCMRTCSRQDNLARHRRNAHQTTRTPQNATTLSPHVSVAMVEWAS